MLSMGVVSFRPLTRFAHPRETERRVQGVEGRAKAVSVSDPSDETGPGRSVEPDWTDEERGDRLVSIIPDVNNSQRCEDHSTSRCRHRPSGAGAGEEVGSSLDGSVPIDPRRDGCGKKKKPYRHGEAYRGAAMAW